MNLYGFSPFEFLLSLIAGLIFYSLIGDKIGNPIRKREYKKYLEYEKKRQATRNKEVDDQIRANGFYIPDYDHKLNKYK